MTSKLCPLHPSSMTNMCKPPSGGSPLDWAERRTPVPSLCPSPLSPGSESLQNHSIPKAPPRFRTLEFYLKEFQNKRHDSKKFKKHKCKGEKVTKIRWKSLSCVQLFATPWTIQFMEFSRPEYWSGWPFYSTGDLSNPGIKRTQASTQGSNEPRPLALQMDFFTSWAIREGQEYWSG